MDRPTPSPSMLLETLLRHHWSPPSSRPWTANSLPEVDCGLHTPSPTAPSLREPRVYAVDAPQPATSATRHVPNRTTRRGGAPRGALLALKTQVHREAHFQLRQSHTAQLTSWKDGGRRTGRRSFHDHRPWGGRMVQTTRNKKMDVGIWKVGAKEAPAVQPGHVNGWSKYCKTQMLASLFQFRSSQFVQIFAVTSSSSSGWPGRVRSSAQSTSSLPVGPAMTPATSSHLPGSSKAQDTVMSGSECQKKWIFKSIQFPKPPTAGRDRPAPRAHSVRTWLPLLMSPA